MLVGDKRLELLIPDSKSGVLPLHQSPIVVDTYRIRTDNPLIANQPLYQLS